MWCFPCSNYRHMAIMTSEPLPQRIQSPTPVTSLYLLPLRSCFANQRDCPNTRAIIVN
jgi:hypothetical protein